MGHFQLKRREEPHEALPRILGWCVAEASEQVARGHLGAHEARKRIREARSCLALGRESLGQPGRRLGALLRDAAHRLAPVRDADALIEVVDELFKEPLGGLGRRELQTLRRAAFANRAKLRPGLQTELESAADAIAAARSQLRELEPIGGWTRMLDGHVRSLRRAREAWRVARRTRDDEDLHAWRKRLKEVRHQLEILTPALEPVLGGWAEAHHEVSDLLGRHRDLGTLRDLSRPLPHARELRKPLEHERGRLVDRALVMGERLHALGPDEQVASLEKWLRAWRRP
jgi:CHAD domain-containing protein